MAARAAELCDEANEVATPATTGIALCACVRCEDERRELGVTLWVSFAAEVARGSRLPQYAKSSSG